MSSCWFFLFLLRHSLLFHSLVSAPHVGGYRNFPEGSGFHFARVVHFSRRGSCRSFSSVKWTHGSSTPTLLAPSPFHPECIEFHGLDFWPAISTSDPPDTSCIHSAPAGLWHVCDDGATLGTWSLSVAEGCKQTMRAKTLPSQTSTLRTVQLLSKKYKISNYKIISKTFSRKGTVEIIIKKKCKVNIQYMDKSGKMVNRLALTWHCSTQRVCVVH